MRVPRKCTPRCYQNRVLPVLLKKHVSEDCLCLKSKLFLFYGLETSMSKCEVPG